MKHETERNASIAENSKDACRLIVSLTSYPARIGCVPAVLASIFAQTKQADVIVLWLAKEQFPNGEEDLPKELRTLLADGKFILKWCRDLKPHKKYFYAFSEYPGDLIVTIDDDVLYEETLLEELYASWQQWPEAVSAGRVHLMTVTEDRRLLPYDCWMRETDAYIHEPSMQYFATGVGGVLYPAWLFADSVMLDEEAILQTCLEADDIWLKAMELSLGIPVVPAHEFRIPAYVPDSQKEGLFRQNLNMGGNDVFLGHVIAWQDAHMEEGLFMDRLCADKPGVCLLGMEAVGRHIARDRENNLTRVHDSNRKLGERHQTDLRRAWDQKIEVDRQLAGAKREIERLQENLRRTTAQKEELETRVREQHSRIKEQSKKIENTQSRLKVSQEKRAEFNEKLKKAKADKKQQDRRIKELEQQMQQQLQKKDARIAYLEQHPAKQLAKKILRRNRKK